MHEISVVRTIDAGHRVVGHTGKCRNLHGHTYEIEVNIEGDIDPTSPGFVLDFGEVKGYIDQWDHKMLLWEEDPVVLAMKKNTYHPANAYLKEEESVVRLPFNPTAENMAQHLAEHFYEFEHVMAVAVTVRETESTEATYRL